ncbi:hypothetical protein K504DRAFT_457137 [Pleomassaria siparia CBS 279.74]|uniref:Cardiolipin synthase N-terminal domain-containing protein n=1 Tax=Pleomassaria siparia CBS 279.74 TaxID=1314801 RepID=A0A6G1KQ22_9PLEO|nr:hypothetical protein K504DRAFT_457137 [Pleomassaria siparia CBS 279.74]
MTFQPSLALLLQFAFVALASASPLFSSSSFPDHGTQVSLGAGGGVVGLAILILHIIVFAEVLNSNRTVPKKLLWCLLVFLFPIGGVIIYILFAKRNQHRPHGGYEAIA